MKWMKSGAWILFFVFLQAIVTGDIGPKRQFAIGIGGGSAYGSIVGIQGEYHPKVSDRVGICLAAGYIYPDWLSFAFGIRGYFLDRKEKLQPFGAAYVGSIGIYSLSLGGGSSIDSNIYGVTVGAGTKYRIGSDLFVSGEVNIFLVGIDWTPRWTLFKRIRGSFGVQYYLHMRER